MVNSPPSLPPAAAPGSSDTYDLVSCPRTCPAEDSHLCINNNWFARPAGCHGSSLLDLPLSMRCMQRLLRFRTGPANLLVS